MTTMHRAEATTNYLTPNIKIAKIKKTCYPLKFFLFASGPHRQYSTVGITHGGLRGPYVVPGNETGLDHKHGKQSTAVLPVQPYYLYFKLHTNGFNMQIINEIIAGKKLLVTLISPH